MNAIWLRSSAGKAGPVHLDVGRAADRKDGAAVPALAQRILDAAIAIGFAPAILRRSRIYGSESCYLHLTFRGLKWIARISDHARGDDGRYPTAHFELVSRDAASGFDEAEAWLQAVAASKRMWWDADPRRTRR